MIRDETILHAVDRGKGEALSLWEIAVLAGVRPRDLGELKHRLRELAQQGTLARQGKGYARAARAAEGTARPQRARGGEGRRPGAGGRRRPEGADGRRRPDADGRRRPGRRAPEDVVGLVRRKAEGYGFLARLDGEGEDLFLPPYEAQRVMDGDRVRVRIVPGRYGRDVAEVVEVLEHARRQLLGTYRARKRHAWIEPLDPLLPDRIAVSPRREIREGRVVKADLIRYEEEGGYRAEVVGEAGERGDPRLEILEIAFRRGFSDAFPPRVLQEARALPDRVLPQDRRGRVDLSQRPLVTIDGPDAKDIDDAILVERVGAGFRLLVAIADVAHYVRPGSVLDEEAFLRGTSVYFPDRVLPMLPPELSNGICSLNPGVDRLCMAVEILFDGEGTVRTAELYQGVMRSHARCTYQEVAALLRGEETGLGDFEPALRAAAELAAKLRARRLERGALDLDLPESKIGLGAEGTPEQIEVEERTEAHRMIEEFMLAANEAVARHFDRLGLPTIYRVHDVPDPEKLETFARLGQAVGVEIEIGEEGLSPVALGAVLRQVENSPQKKALHMLLLRAMMQAVYDPENIGHYGLASEYYLHFTAPIRRYPDLVVHRLLKEHWGRRGRIPGKARVQSIEEELEAVATHSSEKERSSMEAEREADRFLKCLFMEDKVGERFDATIVGVADFGVFAEIDAYLIEGLVRGEEIGVEFHLDQERQRLVFPRSGRSFGVGEKVRVELAGVDLPRRQIHLALVADEEGRLLPSRKEEPVGRRGEEGRPPRGRSRPPVKKDPRRGRGRRR